MLPPMAKPINARWLLMLRCCHSSPLWLRLQKAASTALGAGKIRLDSQPVSTAICQRITSASGSARGQPIQDALRVLCHRGAPQLCDTFAEHRCWPPLRPCGHRLKARGCFLLRQIEVREQQFADAVGLFQMRIAGENEGVDAQIGIFLHARRDRRAVAHQCGAGAAAHRADAGPQVRADLRVILLPPCSAAMRRWPTESKRAKACCALAMVSSSRCAISRSAACRLFGGFRTMTCRRIPKRTGGLRCRFGAHLFNLLFNLRRRLSRVRYSSTCSAARSCAAAEDPPK